MSDKLLESIRRMAKEGKFDAEVTPELTFAAIMDTNIQTRENAEKLEGLDKKVDDIKTNDLPHIELRIAEVARIQNENPSLIWLLRFRTSKTVKILLTAAVCLIAAGVIVNSIPALQKIIFAVLGIPGV